MGHCKVLVVDDDHEIRRLLHLVLEDAGYEVVEAPNGLRLISVLQVDRPALILLDVMMSWIDGFELCRSLKRNPHFRDIPICFLSGRRTPEDIRRGLLCGAADYLIKPINLPLLVDRVGRLLP